MAARFVNVDHDTPLLLPPDLRDWVAADHMVHFVMDAVDALDLRRARVSSFTATPRAPSPVVVSKYRFHLRGLAKAELEWTLVTTSYNLKRLFNLGMALKTA